MGSNFDRTWLFAGIFLIMLSATTGTQGLADEVVIDRRVKSMVSIGDFDCSKCAAHVPSSLNLIPGTSTGDLTAGRLWQFFDSQGLESVESMTICLDIEPWENRGFGLDSVALRIEDPEVFGRFITDVSFGENSIVVPDHEITFHKPEAKLELALGYDFMERFSADSTEAIQFDFSSERDFGFNPVFAIEGKQGLFPSGRNLIALCGFTGFWILVFFGLNLLTRKKVKLVDATATSITRGQERRAISA